MIPANHNTTEGQTGDPVRQFSIFLPNRVGALLDVVKLLNEHNVEVLALSIQDSTDSAVTRLIVSDPDLVTQLFDQKGVFYRSCDVLVIELTEAAELGKMLACVLMAEVNLDFSYPLMVRPRGRAAVVAHVEEADCASNILEGQGFRILRQCDLSR